MRNTDENWDDWKPGDLIVWDEELLNIMHLAPFVLLEKDEHGRVFWKEEGDEVYMTRATNMKRLLIGVEEPAQGGQ